MRSYSKLKIERFLDQTLGNFVLSTLSFFKNRKNKIELDNIKTITVVKLSALGDSILLLPLLKKLKEDKNLKLRIICGSDNIDIFKGLNFIDDIEEFNVKSKNPFYLISRILKLRKDRSDFGIDTTQTSFFSTFLTYLTAKNISGFSNKYDKNRSKLLDYSFKFDENKHIVYNFLDLAKPLGLKYENSKINLVEPKFDRSNMIKINRLIGKQKLIGIHPCNSTPFRAWPKEDFAKVMSFILDNYKFNICLVGSKSEENETKELVSLLSDNQQKRIINLCGKLSIKEFIALSSKLKFFIANDGGLMHITSSMNIPVLDISIYANPLNYSPFNEEGHIIVGKPECRPDPSKGKHSWNLEYNSYCQKSIKTTKVINKVKEIMKKI